MDEKLATENMNESGKSETLNESEKPAVSAPTEDTDFELTADMMVHEFDDETTLNDEEDDIETNDAELADLAKEGEMPIEELYALYYGGNNPYNEEANDPPDDNLEQFDSNDDQNSDSATKRNLRSMSALASSAANTSDSSDEEVTTLTVDDRKKPRVGDDYQASEIPDTLQGKADDYNADDEQVWVPWKLPEDSVAEYLKEVTIHATSSSRTEADSASCIQDNEDALFLLRQCGNDTEEALRRYKCRPPPLTNDIQIWSEEECQQFESGLALYGKDFYLIHVNNLRSRSVRDIVKFYYIWKKSERYDQFTSKTRLGKRKEMFSASVTDYMDRLLDETDNACTSSLLNYNGGNHMKYNTMAHNVALIEHLRQLEAAHVGEHDQSHTNVATVTEALDSTASQSPLQTHITGTTNGEISLTESDINQVLSDLTQNSSGFR